MPLRRLVVGPLESNCYIVYDELSRDALVVDAGGDAEAIIAEIEALGLVPRVLFSTHGHVDHVEANRALKERFPDMTLALHSAEREHLLRPTLNLSYFLGRTIEPPEPELTLEEGDEIAVGALSFRIIHVPGHTPGGAAAVGDVDGEPVVFSGDALFACGIGRVDFPGGDEATLLRAIREKLFTLPDGTRVLSGHGPETTIGEEKRSNPFLREP
jgi:glyoxylase-like metal-dependent hydrolase (beta-lactamase superfamily II)